MMKDPRLRDVSGDVVLSSLPDPDDPFAEYMWMEHEEEFNRQVRV